MKPDILNPSEIAEIVKVNCSYCGEEMECQKAMLKEDTKHVCEFCDYAAREGANEKEKMEISLRERKLSKYQDEIADLVIAVILTHPPGITRDELKEMNKREISEEFFIGGATSAFDFILRAAGPEALMKLKNTDAFADMKEVMDMIEKKADKIMMSGMRSVNTPSE